MAYNLADGEWVRKSLDAGNMISFDVDFVRDAKKHNIKFGTAEFIIYQFIRYCETRGNAIRGQRLMSANYEYIKNWFGFEKAEDVRTTLNELKKKKAVAHIWTDKKWYKDKKMVWVSAEWLAEHTNLSVGEPTLGVGEPTQASPVPPLGEYNNKYKSSNTNKKDYTHTANALTLDAQSSDIPPSADASVADATDDASPLSGLYGATITVTKPSTPTVSADSTQPKKQGGVVKNTTLNSDPFAANVKVDVDLAKKVSEDKKKRAINCRRAGGILARLYEIMGVKKKPQKCGNAINRIVGLLDEGYTELELIKITKRAMEHDYYKTQDITLWLQSDNARELNNDAWWKKYKEKKRYELGGLMY